MKTEKTELTFPLIDYPLHASGPVLESIDSPADLKRLSIAQLISLAEEVRVLIIDTVLKNGGHLASNLGVVELTIALHYVFNLPEDRLIWDVGHQSYTHKILTGRRRNFSKIRMLDGISGFPKRSESIYDIFGTGHSSTSISAAAGMAEASRINKDGRRIIAVIGDGAFSGGMALEGLNHTGWMKDDMMIVLNDNQMSISRNVGALSSWLARSVSSLSSDRLSRLVSFPLPGILFRELGFNYVGPVPGHHLKSLIQALKKTVSMSGPVLFHTLTQKGRGYEDAERKPSRFHSIGPIGKSKDNPVKTRKTYSGVFGDTLIRLAQNNSRIVAITAGMTLGTGLSSFGSVFPDRLYDVGIAEQHAVTFAAGMAVEGFLPVVAIYSTFLQRAYDQIIHDICLQNLPVIFMIDRAGIVGEDGPTHHGLFDISYLRCCPNLIFMAPKDCNELQHMLNTATRLRQPVAIRYPRGFGEQVSMDLQFKELPVGKAEILRQGSDVVIIGVGSAVYPCLEAAKNLEASGVSCGVVNSRFIKPMDSETLTRVAANRDLVVTVEENICEGGFGSAVLEALSLMDRVPKMLRIGIQDVFVEQGTVTELRKKYHLDSTGIAERIKSVHTSIVPHPIPR